MQFDVEQRTIFLTKHGSRAYGLATPTSDLDIKGFCIEPLAYHLGYLNNFEQQERLANKGHPADSVIYSLKKFTKLAAECNPNIVEVLHVDDDCIIKCDEFGERLRSHRNDFLSKKAMHTFSGYAYAQIKRIKSHRNWLLQGPTAKPTRQEFNLNENPDLPTGQLKAAQAAVAKKLQHWNFENMDGLDPDLRILIQNTISELFAEATISSDSLYTAAARNIGISENFLDLLDRERKYNNALNNWNQYQNWKATRNLARAALEAESGYDRKMASHAVRLSRMCCEILEGKGVIVKRPDAEELLAIKNKGIWSYEQVLEEVESLNKRAQELYQTSKLPHGPNHHKLDALVVSITQEYLAKNG
jgi:predicted nucleotidyltransferase